MTRRARATHKTDLIKTAPYPELSELSESLIKFPEAEHSGIVHLAGNPFIYDISGSDKKWLRVSFFGQDEMSILPYLNELMTYEPFCTYKRRVGSGIGVTYEWNRSDQEGRLNYLRRDSAVSELMRIVR